MSYIDSSDLDNWASDRRAQGDFPRLIMDLIRAVINPSMIRIPSGSAICMPGVDGVVECDDEHIFVPTGKSVWEFGTGGRTDSEIKRKAKDDYEKRSDKSSLDHENITFIFVTPRCWASKESWLTERRQERKWYDVRAYDAVDIIQWMEDAQAIKLKFGVYIRRLPDEGLWTPDQAWEEWRYRTNPPLSDEIILTGREKMVEDLIEFLEGPPSTISVRGDSPKEAWAFALASIRRIDSEEKRLLIYSRLIVVENVPTAIRLQNVKNLIILIKNSDKQVSGVLSERGCHVIISEGNDSRSPSRIIELKRATHRPFVEALCRLGKNEEEAEKLTRECGRSVTVLQRRIPHANIESPEWAGNDKAATLLPILLAGRWEAGNELDRSIVCELFGEEDYYGIEDSLQDYLLINEPPLRRIGNLWTLTAPADAFQLLAKRLTASHLERFETAFNKVFSAIDQKVETPPDEWPYLGIRGEKAYSEWLRSGMVDSLLMIAVLGESCGMSGYSPDRWVEHLIRELPGVKDDWRIIASFGDLTPKIMEASPEFMLGCLAQLIEKHPNDVKKMFLEGKGLEGGMHTGILWGLETLAWSPNHLAEVAILLLQLSQIDPGGRLSNRPINSLKEIFLSRYPRTNASVDHKIKTIGLMKKKCTETTWKLIEKLIPTFTGSAHITPKPVWMDYGSMDKEAITIEGRLRYESEIIDCALGLVSNIPERWGKILDSFNIIVSNHPEKRSIILSLLNQIAENEASKMIRIRLSDLLRSFIHRHRLYDYCGGPHGPDSFQGQISSEDILISLDMILKKLEPKDAVDRFRWLFDEHYPDINFKSKDYDEQDKHVATLRESAVNEIIAEKGHHGIIELGLICKEPCLAAISAVPLIDSASQIISLIEDAITNGDNGIYLASCISAEAEKRFGDDWKKIISEQYKMKKWPDEVFAKLLQFWPTNENTWDFASKLNPQIELELWRTKPVWLIKGSSEAKSYQITKLIDVGRASEAFRCIIRDPKDVPTRILTNLFYAYLKELSSVRTKEDANRLIINPHDISRFFKELRRRSDIELNELASMEYHALPLLGYLEAEGLTIHKLLADEPLSYVDFICTAYPAENLKTAKNEISDHEKTRIDSAVRIIRGMTIILGFDSEKDFDEGKLQGWINVVREEASKRDRVKITDIMIGEILAQAPHDPGDGAWPHKAIRTIIEAYGSDEIEEGLRIKRFNMRGTVMRGYFEGGDQERTLAKTYSDWARIAREESPRTARLLTAISKHYVEEGKFEDDQAEQRQL